MYNELKGYFKSENVNELYMRVQLHEENKTRKRMNKMSVRKEPEKAPERATTPELK